MSRQKRLVQKLTADPGIASGETRAKLVVDAADAVGIAESVTTEIDKGTRARAGLAAQRGTPIACAAGCNACCEEPVMVLLPEALRVARWLARPENASARERFVARYPAWREAAGDGVDTLAELSADPNGSERYSAAHRRQWRKRVMCAFDHDGRCSIYEVRPLLCRDAHALETNERCVPGAPIPAARLAFGPLDDFVPTAAVLLRATHNAIDPKLGGKTNRLESLCVLVARLLEPTR